MSAQCQSFKNPRATLPCDAGFTLVETLVALMVLSFTAIMLSATLGSAFKSYQAIKASGEDLAQSQALHRLMREAGRTQYYGGEPVGLTFDEERLNLSASAALEVREGDEYWAVHYVDADNARSALWESRAPLRFDLKRHGASRSIHLQRQRLSEWEDIVSAPLLVSIPARCRFDIVLRRCRS